MGLLRTKIDPTTAKNIMYMCAAAPILAFGARMVNSAMECVLTSRSARRRRLGAFVDRGFLACGSSRLERPDRPQ